MSRHVHRWRFHLSGRLGLDLANTVSWRASAQPIERLAGYGDFLAWCLQSKVISDREARRLQRAASRNPGVAAATLRRALALREAIYRIFSALVGHRSPQAVDVAVLDGEFRAALRQLRLEAQHRNFMVSWMPATHAATRALAACARSVVDLLMSDDVRRLKMCPSANCGWLFVDTTRSGTRRWCDMRVCGNREKARRHYARQRVIGHRSDDHRRQPRSLRSPGGKGQARSI